MEFHCTSHIRLSHNIKNNTEEFICHWQKSHYGHVVELQHIRLTQEEKQVVASKLISGVTPAK